jgi:CHAT domain-containing protein
MAVSLSQVERGQRVPLSRAGVFFSRTFTQMKFLRVVATRGAAIVAASLMAVGAIVWVAMAHRLPADERFASEYRRATQRPMVARFSWLPYSQAPDGRFAMTASLRTSAALTLQSNAPTPARAAGAMISGRTTAAIALLESAVESDPNDAALWNDLSGARYELARTKDDYRAYLSALAATDSALDRRPRSALFNRALVLDAIGFHNDAAAAFESLAASEPGSEWTREATARARAAKRPSDLELWLESIPSLENLCKNGDSAQARLIVKRFPQFARAWAEGEFPARWGEAYLAGYVADATHWSRVTTCIGRALIETSGESIVADIAATMERADTEAARALAEAHVGYRTARKLFKSREVTASLSLLREAERRFVRARSPAALGAAYFLANALFDAHALDEAMEIHARLDRSVPQRYASLRACVEWLRALLYAWSNRPFESLVAARTAIREFDRLGEHENAARMRSMLASLLAALGNGVEADRHRLRSFRDAVQSGNPKVIEVVLNHAARDAMNDRQWELARALLRLQNARPAASPRMAFDVKMALAFVDAQISGAAPDFRAAAAAAQGVTDPSLREDALDALAFGQATHPRREAGQAVRLLTEVIDYRKSHDRIALLPAPYVERARAFREVGNSASAEADLRSAIELIDSAGANIQSETLRDIYTGTSRDAHRDLAEMLFADRRPSEAFIVADRSRARALVERLQLPERERTVQALQRRIPEEAVVAHYTALSDRLAITVVERSRWKVVIVPTSRTAIEASRNALTDAILRGDADAETTAAMTLYRSLIAPLAAELEIGKRLVIIPDEATTEVPFAPLRAPDGTRLMMRNIVMAPSAATVFRKRAKTPRNVVVVADPAFDSATFPHLERLPAARREARLLEALYPQATVLQQAEATKAAVVDALRDSDMFHVAAHAFADPIDATRSFILLAPSGRSGALHSADIAQLQLTGAPLVTIAACRTSAVGGGSASIRSLALAFFAAGSGTVVSTLWPVDDESASAMMGVFYREIASGSNPAAALRTAQLDAIENGIPTRQWAAFQMHTVVVD